MLFGFGRVPGCLGLGALFLWDEWRDERTDCQRGGCMVVPGAVVSPGHTRRLRRLSCRAPHNSPCTLMPYLAQTDGAYSTACDPISSVFFRDHTYIGGVCLIRGYNIFHGKSHSSRKSAVIFPHRRLFIPLSLIHISEPTRRS